mgnify:FL=1
MGIADSVYLIDLYAGLILDVQGCGSTLSNERGAAKIMIERGEATFDIKPDRLVGDTAYGTDPMLNWMVNEKQIVPQYSGVGSIGARRGYVDKERLAMGCEVGRVSLPSREIATQRMVSV